jgi:AcrR family transcriptional regulator
MELNTTIANASKRRQARGERRIDEILDAAERVFVRIGYARTTTNHIAAEAKASPATLYHFFENKEAVAEQLAIRYAKDLMATHQQIHLSALIHCSLEEMIENIVDRFLQFHRQNPALKVLFDASSLSTETLNWKNELDLAFRSRLADLFQARKPGMNRDSAFWAAQVCSCIFQGMLRLATAKDSNCRERAVPELKNLLAAYLERLLTSQPD